LAASGRSARCRPERGGAPRARPGLAGVARPRERARPHSRGAAGRAAARGARAVHLRRGRARAGHSNRHRDVAPLAWPGAAAPPGERRWQRDPPQSSQMSGPPVTEADLHAYVDGALPQARATEVEAYLAERPDEAARIAAYREQAQALRRESERVLDEPLPERLARPRRGGVLRRYAAVAAWV